MVKIKHEMSGACSLHGRNEKRLQIFNWNT